jgi:metallophosphoesterase superfamily enzyme
MTFSPAKAARVVELAPNVSALAPGVLHLHATGTIVAADVHFAYEDVIGGALPTWSIAELVSTLLIAARSVDAREIFLLGDVIHGSVMSEGAAREVQRALEALRDVAMLTIVAGNHEGRTRGAAILGETVESARRDGWLLLHGDRGVPACDLAQARGVVLGHLHPSLPLGGGANAPAFVYGDRVVVVPALTPYSGGLSVFGDDCLCALAPFDIGARKQLHVVAATGEMLYPFGNLATLQKAISAPRPAPRSKPGFRRKFLKPDR